MQIREAARTLKVNRVIARIVSNIVNTSPQWTFISSFRFPLASVFSKQGLGIQNLHLKRVLEKRFLILYLFSTS